MNVKHTVFGVFLAVLAGVFAVKGLGQYAQQMRRQAELDEIAIDMGLKPHPSQTEDFSAKQVKQLFGTEEVRLTIANADKVDVFLVDSSNLDVRWSQAKLSDYPIVDGPIPIQREMANGIIRSLNDARNYGWSMRKGCLPLPGVRMQFTRNGETADVLYCFECNILAIGVDDQLVGGEDFDMIRPQLVRALKQLFPENSVIQGLPETGCGLFADN